MLHGRADRTVPWEGRITGNLRFAPTLYAARVWAENGGCARQPERRRERDGRIEILTFTDCAADTEVELQILEGWGHRWPAPFHTARLQDDDPLKDFDASRAIWSFFERH